MAPTTHSPLSCVLIGADSLLIQCGEILLSRPGWDIRAVATRAEPVREWAARHDLTVRATGPGLIDGLAELDFDYLFSITNLSILPDAVLDLPRRASINFHDGPLPRYAGMYAPAWALLNGETEYGVSFHDMRGEIDAGDLFGQRCFPVSPGETSLSLNTRCFEAAIETFSELVDGLRDGSLTPSRQDLAARSYFGRFERPERASICDWERPAEQVERLVRALDFGDYENAFAAAKIWHEGRICLVGSARAIEDAEAAHAGTLLRIDPDGWTVACGDGTALRVADLKCPFGRSLGGEQAAERLAIRVGERLNGPAQPLCERLEPKVEAAARAESFWVRRLSRLQSAEIPYLRSDRSGLSGYAQIELSIPSGFSETYRGDASTALIAGFASYLARVNGRTEFDLTLQDEAVTGEIEEAGELFSRDVPLSIDLPSDLSVDAAISRLSEGLSGVRVKRGFLNDVIRRYPQLKQNPILASGRLASVAVVISDEFDDSTLRVGTDFALVIDSEGANARVVYDTARQRGEDAERIARQLCVFYDGMSDSGSSLAKLPLLDDTEREKILRTWNATGVEHDRAQTVASLFDAQCARTPGATALVFEGESLTYAELSERANELARRLVDLGVGRDRLVGVYVERSIEMVVAILGVLKAGGAYLPLDPTYPEDRIAYMIEDSRAEIVLTEARHRDRVPAGAAQVVAVDDGPGASAGESGELLDVSVDPSDLAYVIYTSGSTGKPKGVMVEHRNVANFFAGMAERVPRATGGVWLAVTSLSFDISVLELLWTLTRGFEVVLFADRDKASHSETGLVGDARWRPMDFGLALWGSDAGPGPRKYDLMLGAARFGDRHGFRSVHTPERHFGAFGGPFPNPSVTGAAIAAVTERIEIRASSCVLPLHHPVRVAEEWAVVDNLSGGRVGLSFASGWQPNDFVIRPEAYADAKAGMIEGAQTVQRLWRGEAVEFMNPKGDLVPTTTLPRPVQTELPSWMTTAGNLDTFRAAGSLGFNVLTHLLGQSLEELAEKIVVYRQARADAGLDPETGVVTCMLHTFVGEDNDSVRELVRGPMKEYLASAMNLVMGFAWSFPAFRRPGGPDSSPEDVDLSTLTDEETDAILEFAFERYYETSGLFGTPEICCDMVDRVKAADIDEIACLIDFGLDTEVALGGLDLLNVVREQANQRPVPVEGDSEAEETSFAAQVAARRVTHMQCTPSHAAMLLTNPDTRRALASVNHLMIGGEAFPRSLAAALDRAGCHDVTNMYGPTETTIWSTTEKIVGQPDAISIGRPIANTQIYILDDGGQPLPVGIAGELLIGGEGVVRGYHERPELTAERFVPDPFAGRDGARLYRTGDLARWNHDGSIDFLGRLDHQVKIRGYRIELGEIEARLAAMGGIRESVVIAREDTPGDHRLVAYLIAESTPIADDTLRAGLRQNLPEFMLPSAFVFLDRYPQTPNGKIDRAALPAPNELHAARQADYKPPSNEIEEQIARIWTDVLRMDPVGIDDNFFDLGGHSLLVVQTHRKLREELDTPVSLTDLYRYPTIRGLAERLSSDGPDSEQAKQSQARGEKRRQALGRRRRRGSA